MMLLSLFGCLEAAREQLRVQVDLPHDRVTVHHRLEDVSHDGERCGPEAAVEGCVAALGEEREAILTALSGVTLRRAAYELDGAELDFVVEFEAPVGFFVGGGYDRVHSIRALSVGDYEAGKPGRPAIAVLVDDDPARVRSELRVSGKARLLRFDGAKGEHGTDLWLVERGRASFEGALTQVREGVPVTHRLVERPGLTEAMKAAGLL